MKVVFFGTPEFAVSSLKALRSSHHKVIGIVSAPAKPTGRGRKLEQPPVAKEVERLGLPLQQPENLRDPVFLSVLRQWDADVFAVVAFRILPEEVFSLPKQGAINLHGSLLPAYRGAAPIQWALWNGETVTGLTTFRIEKAVDTGNLLKTIRVEIAIDDDTGSLSQRMALRGADLMIQTLTELESGTLAATPQDSSLATPAPKIRKEHCSIDWQRTVTQIRNQVRALSPEPGAETVLEGQKLKIYRCEVVRNKSNLRPGEALIEDRALIIGTNEGALNVTQLQIQSKAKMDILTFLRGCRLRGKFNLIN